MSGLENMSEKRIKVLLIVGWGRSGTTILDNVLGQYEGFFSVGELRYIWDRGLIQNRVCGCGTPFNDCPAWKAVIQDAFGKFENIESKRMADLREKMHSRDALLSMFSFGRQLLVERHGEYIQNLARICKSVQAFSNCNVIVDSSKFPSHAYALKLIPWIHLHVVHLIRDPRAVVFSWKKKRLYDIRNNREEYMDQPGIFSSCWFWSTWNVEIEMILRNSNVPYMQLRYEDLMKNPRRYVEEILIMLNEPRNNSPFCDGHTVKLGSSHSVSGNPARFKRGLVQMHADEEWVTQMKSIDRLIVDLLTFPLMLKYRYF
jgi:hypothetical protein